MAELMVGGFELMTLMAGTSISIGVSTPIDLVTTSCANPC